MSRKSLLHVTVVLGLCLLLSLGSFSVSKAVAKRVTIKAISAWPSNDASVRDDYLTFIKNANKILQKKYPGELKINYIGGPEAIPMRDQPEALRVGTVEMYYGTPAYYVGIAPAANISKLTELTPWEERENGAYDIFNEIHQKKLNAFYLGRLGSYEKFQLWTRVRVKTPEDLKGLRIRVSPMYTDFIKALGAIPIETKPGDIYQALERGVVDGYCWPFTKIRSWGFHEVTKYVVGPSFYMVCHPVIVNLDKWNSLPRHLQQALMDIMKQEEHAVVARDIEKNRSERKLLEQAGLKFIEFSPADAKRYYDLAYSAGWEGVTKRSPEYARKLRKLLSK